MSTQQAVVGNPIRTLHGSPDDFLELVEARPHGEEFILAELPDHLHTIAWRLTNTWALNKIGTRRRDCSGTYDSKCNIWEVSEQFEQRVREYDFRGPELPCGHHGFTNLGGGRFECQREWCDAEFGREAVEEALKE